VGINYFKLDTTVSGSLVSGPLFADGDPLQLSYRTHLTTSDPWSLIAGANVEISDHWAAQGELDFGKASHRLVLSLTFRP